MISTWSQKASKTKFHKLDLNFHCTCNFSVICKVFLVHRQKKPSNLGGGRVACSIRKSGKETLQLYCLANLRSCYYFLCILCDSVFCLSGRSKPKQIGFFGRITSFFKALSWSISNHVSRSRDDILSCFTHWFYWFCKLKWNWLIVMGKNCFA